MKYFLTRSIFEKSDWIVLAIMALVALGFGASEAWRWFSTDSRAPLQNLKLEPINAPIMAGDFLIVRATREKVRDDCVPVISIRTATNVSTGKIHEIPDRVWSGGKASDEFVDLRMDTSDLIAGNYVGNIKTIFPCPSYLFTYDSEFLFEIKASK